MIRMQKKASKQAGAQGFTLVEVMISAAIVLIGLLAVLGSIGAALASTKYSQEEMIAKQKALEAMESIYTARNTQQITWAQIKNISSGGIFTDGYTQMWAAGPDGLVGTADDTVFPPQGPCPSGVECIPLPGPDGILGTADDTTMILTNFQRQILVSNVLESDGVTINPNLKQVTVNVQYTTSSMQGTRTYTVNALISAFR
jgi:prepilin-type N-terminal cleavage/methylation domain-containing protein